MNSVQASQVESSFQIVKVLADTIRELKEIPSGHLYAQVMGFLSIQQYNQVIDLLKRTKLVTESAHVLKWVEPNDSHRSC